MKYGLLPRRKTVPALFVVLVCSLTCHAADLPAGAVVAAIRTASGNHLTAANGGGGCFAKPKDSNPANLFLKWTCGPLFDPKSATADVVTQAALDFLTKYADLWQLNNPAKELKRRYAQPNWDVEFRQWNSGVRVFDADIHVSFARGVPLWVRSDYIPGLDSLNKSPKLSGAQAVEAARKHLAATGHVSLEAVRVAGKPILGISASQRNEPARPARLIYQLSLSTDGRPGYVGCEIDAHSGEIVSENYVGPLTARPIR